MTAPGLQVLDFVSRSAKRVWKGYFDLVGARQENAQLRQSLEEYRQKEVRYQEAQQA